MKRVSQKVRTAYHEAGHAVIGRVMRQECGGVSIVRDMTEMEAGHAHIGVSANLGRILSLMAGAEAEEEFFGSCPGGDGDDRREISKMLNQRFPVKENVSIKDYLAFVKQGRSLPPPSPEEAERLSHVQEWEKRLRRHTRAIVHRHRDKIERVAAQLVKKGKLSAAEIDNAITSNG